MQREAPCNTPGPGFPVTQLSSIGGNSELVKSAANSKCYKIVISRMPAAAAAL